LKTSLGRTGILESRVCYHEVIQHLSYDYRDD